MQWQNATYIIVSLVAVFMCIFEKSFQNVRFVAKSISVLLASVEWGLNSNVSQIFTINTIKHPEPVAVAFNMLHHCCHCRLGLLPCTLHEFTKKLIDAVLE